MSALPVLLLWLLHFMLYDAAQLYTIKRLPKYKKPAKPKKKTGKSKPDKKVAKPRRQWIVKQEVLKPYQHKSGVAVVPSDAENRIRTCLNTFDLLFITECSFKGLLSDKGQPLRFDFYIPGKKLAFEYDGKPYHKAADVKRRDKLKDIFCKVNGIKLVRLNAEHWADLETHIIRAVVTS